MANENDKVAVGTVNIVASLRTAEVSAVVERIWSRLASQVTVSRKQDGRDRLRTAPNTKSSREEP
ncbi:MAG: hypothetical protein RLZZ450_5729 [Pseudomonadota bacterium]|jgi:hypothetical protein